MAVFTGTLSPTEALTTFEKLEHAARRAIMEAGGSLSHHHGVGKHRAPLVGQIQSPAMLHAMRQLKSVVDPSEILGAKNGAWSDAVATHVLANLDDGASLHDARSEGFIDDSELREAQRWADADDPESGDSSLGTEGTDAERARTRSLGSREQGGIAAEIAAENRAEAEKPRDEGVGVGINSQLSSLRPGSQLTLGITEAPAPGHNGQARAMCRRGRCRRAMLSGSARGACRGRRGSSRRLRPANSLHDRHRCTGAGPQAPCRRKAHRPVPPARCAGGSAIAMGSCRCRPEDRCWTGYP